MSGLERELRGLAASMDWPEAPDVASTVARRVGERRPRPRRRRLAIAVAVVLAALLAVLAVPPARTAILDWLGIGAARIVRVDELPSLAPEPGLEILGDRVSIDGAAARAGFPLARPPRGEPSPDEVRVAPGTRVSYVWRDGDRVRLLITQFPGSVDDPGLLKKLVGESTRVEQLAGRRTPGRVARGRSPRRLLRRAGRERSRRPGVARREHAAGRSGRRHRPCRRSAGPRRRGRPRPRDALIVPDRTLDSS